MIVIHCILHINRDSGYLSSYPWLYHIAKPASSKKKPPLLHIIHTSYLSIPRVYIFLYLHAPPKLRMALSPPVALCRDRVQRRRNTGDGRAPALTACACNGISPRRLRLLVACLGMVEERAAERGIVDGGGCLLFLGEEEE
jgi:hypothetical protein